MNARHYVEALASELSRVRQNGVVLSPADTMLALSWHAARVPLDQVVRELRRLARKRPRSRSAVAQPVSLQLLEKRFEPQVQRRLPPTAVAQSLPEALLAASADPALAGSAAWRTIAESADQLLEGSGDAYWTALHKALKATLRGLPRDRALAAGKALRSRLARRPPGMPRRRYQRSLQLMLIAAASERLGLPPRPFLL